MLLLFRTHFIANELDIVIAYTEELRREGNRFAILFALDL